MRLDLELGADEEVGRREGDLVAVNVRLLAHGLPASQDRRRRQVRARGCEVLVVGVEDALAVGELRVVDDDVPNDVALQLRHLGTPLRDSSHESAELVIDQHLTGEADHTAIGAERELLAAFLHGPALELSMLVDRQEVRRGAEFEDRRVPEIREDVPVGEELEGVLLCHPRVGVHERRIGDVAQDHREIGSRVEGAAGDLMRTAEAPLALKTKRLASDRRRVHAAPFTCPFKELEGMPCPVGMAGCLTTRSW